MRTQNHTHEAHAQKLRSGAFARTAPATADAVVATWTKSVCVMIPRKDASGLSGQVGGIT